MYFEGFYTYINLFVNSQSIESTTKQFLYQGERYIAHVHSFVVSVSSTEQCVEFFSIQTLQKEV